MDLGFLIVYVIMMVEMDSSEMESVDTGIFF